MKKPESHDPRNTATADHQCAARAEPLLAVEKQAEKRRLQEESEHAFHGQRLPDHASGKAREVRPVRAKLKFHGNSGHHAEHEVDAEDPRPETRRLVVGLIDHCGAGQAS